MPARTSTAARALVPSARRALAAAVLLACLVPASAAAQSDAAPDGPRVVIAFLPLPDEPPALDDGAEPPLAFRPILDRLAVARAALDRDEQRGAGPVRPAAGAARHHAGNARLAVGLRAQAPARARARPSDGRGGACSRAGSRRSRAPTRAPADIVPGLLAGSVPGGAAYVGVNGRSQREAIVAADRAGRVSSGLARLRRATSRDACAGSSRSHRLVVVGLPTGIPSDVELDKLIERPRARRSC